MEKDEQTYDPNTGSGLMVRADGTREWYRRGRLHREDGPAIELSDGSKGWAEDGVWHRVGGPAVELADGTTQSYIRGRPPVAPCDFANHRLPQTFATVAALRGEAATTTPTSAGVSIRTRFREAATACSAQADSRAEARPAPRSLFGLGRWLR